jgi:hypothetical protein
MFSKFSACILVFCLLFASGYASTLESVNRGAEKVGQTEGQVMRVPHSASEGVS